MPQPVVNPYALTRISRSELSIARTANAAQSSSGEKQTAIAAPAAIEAVRNVGAIAPNASAKWNAH